MKAKHLIPILPILSATLLAGCGQTNLNLNEGAANSLANTALTATPVELVVYPNDRPSIPDGAPAFQQNCATCHSAGGAASSVKFDEQWAHSTKPIDIYRLIAFGGSSPDKENNKHPKFGDKLSVAQMWNIAVYVRSLGQPALTKEEIEAIDPVFGSNCAVCHGTKGDGDGPLARNLEPMPANFQRFDRFFNRTDDVLFDHIANGIRWEGMPNFLGKKDGKKNVHFDEAYVRKLVQYVHKFHVNNAPVMAAANAPGAGAPASSSAGSAAGGAAAPNATTGTSSAPAAGGQKPQGAQ
jgi:cbb3-type cytochrome c oxidase subunit III